MSKEIFLDCDGILPLISLLPNNHLSLETLFLTHDHLFQQKYANDQSAFCLNECLTQILQYIVLPSIILLLNKTIESANIASYHLVVRWERHVKFNNYNTIIK